MKGSMKIKKTYPVDDEGQRYEDIDENTKTKPDAITRKVVTAYLELLEMEEEEFLVATQELEKDTDPIICNFVRCIKRGRGL